MAFSFLFFFATSNYSNVQRWNFVLTETLITPNKILQLISNYHEQSKSTNNDTYVDYST